MRGRSLPRAARNEPGALPRGLASSWFARLKLARSLSGAGPRGRAAAGYQVQVTRQPLPPSLPGGPARYPVAAAIMPPGRVSLAQWHGATQAQAGRLDGPDSDDSAAVVTRYSGPKP